VRTERYIERIHDAAKGEILGEILFRKLANRYSEQSGKIERLALLEIKASRYMARLLARHNVSVEAISDGEGYTDRLINASPLGTWYEFLRWMHGIVYIYVEQYDELYAQALEGDSAELKFLSDHERALLYFLDAEISGRPDSLQPIELLLSDDR
jgi:hypothetical protein